jgi:uncharacterized Zn finger protein
MANQDGQDDRAHCPFCSDCRVQSVVVTRMVVYMRCDACGQVWTFPERRQLPRETDIRKLFLF